MLPDRPHPQPPPRRGPDRGSASSRALVHSRTRRTHGCLGAGQEERRYARTTAVSRSIAYGYSTRALPWRRDLRHCVAAAHIRASSGDDHRGRRLGVWRFVLRICRGRRTAVVVGGGDSGAWSRDVRGGTGRRGPPLSACTCEASTAHRSRSSGPVRAARPAAADAAPATRWPRSSPEASSKAVAIAAHSSPNRRRRPPRPVAGWRVVVGAQRITATGSAVRAGSGRSTFCARGGRCQRRMVPGVTRR